jgi:hypothetical protein
MQDSKTPAVAQNFHGYKKEFLRKLLTIWARALKKKRQPWSMENGAREHQNK